MVRLGVVVRIGLILSGYTAEFGGDLLCRCYPIWR